ncbi:MAG: hypothetical protein IT512_12025 [Rhodocyclaceae bacterium]|nr:hypothetical protein [Rhodocyclaceae bacterium]
MTTKNPHLEHGVGISGLVHNLQNLPQEWAGATFHGAYEPQRLAAIALQADNVKTSSLSGLRAAGKILAIAAQSGELATDENIDAGWLVEFLAELADAMDVLAHNARYVQEHGPLTDPPAP